MQVSILINDKEIFNYESPKRFSRPSIIIQFKTPTISFPNEDWSWFKVFFPCTLEAGKTSCTYHVEIACIFGLRFLYQW